MSLRLAALLDADSQRYNTASCQVASLAPLTALHGRTAPYYMLRRFGHMHASVTSMLQSLEDSTQMSRGTEQVRRFQTGC